MTTFGPGLVTIGSAPHDFSCEVTGGSTTHEYETVGEAKTYLCGTKREARRKRNDGVTFELETNLRASGLYAFLHTLDADDPEPQEIAYTPNTDDGASWEGTIVPLMPAAVAGSEYNAELTATVTWPAVGHLAFTAGADPE